MSNVRSHWVLWARCLVEGRARRLSGEVQNPGVGGLLLHLPELLPVGSGVTLVLTGPIQELRLPGRIVWPKARLDERPARGVAFTDPTASQQSLHQVVLAEFLMPVGQSEPAASP